MMFTENKQNNFAKQNHASCIHDTLYAITTDKNHKS